MAITSIASATVKGGFWPENGVTTLAQIGAWRAGRRKVAMALGRKGMMAVREVMETLNGAAAGNAASKVLARIEANTELGGKRTIENETIYSANTAAADVTVINEDLLAFSTKTYDPTPPANLDGNPLGTR